MNRQIRSFFRTVTARRGIVVAIVLAALLAQGCALIRLKQDIEQAAGSALLYGTAVAPDEAQGPILVVAYQVDQGRIEIAGNVRIGQPGAWEMLVPTGDYYLAAFMDRNHNARFDAQEAWAHFGAPELIDARSHRMIGDLHLALRADAQEPHLHLMNLTIGQEEIVHRAVAGEVVDAAGMIALDQHSGRGYWEPFTFFKEVGANIWFVEPYDPDKIPVLFVHGAGGDVSGWNFFFDNMDRTRFQPWFFYYPSGAPLEYCVYFLALKISDLKAQYDFEQMGLVAHSMGGLVVRSFLVSYEEYFPFVRLFISISTPWGGVEMAKQGVEQAPVVVPSWRDVASDSDFINSLYMRGLPANVRYYLLFGYDGSPNPLRPNNDGTLTMESMLDARAQQEATRIFGFNQDHSSILLSEETTALFNDIAHKELVERQPEQTRPTEKEGFGSIAVQMELDGKQKRAITLALLLLEPASPSTRERLIYLDPYADHQTIESIPAGDYTASLLIPAYHTTPSRVPLRIDRDKPTTVRFGGIPQGILVNVVWPAVGMESPVPIRAIQLEGPGFRRELVPDDFSFETVWDAALSHQDFYHDGLFCFLDLPKGKYRLTIHADGYHPHTADYRVTPGQYGNIPHIQMVPLERK